MVSISYNFSQSVSEAVECSFRLFDDGFFGWIELTGQRVDKRVEKEVR